MIQYCACKNSVCKLTLCALLLAIPSLAAERKAIVPPEFAPKPGASAGPFSPAILVNRTLYVAGQIGRDLKTGQVPDNFEKEVQTCFDNIQIIMKAANMTLDDAVSVTVYMTDMDLFARMNAVYMKNFKEPRPARATVGVAKLAAPQAHLEISVTATK